jgi:polysaccharide export outer membrane protein
MRLAGYLCLLAGLSMAQSPIAEPAAQLNDSGVPAPNSVFLLGPNDQITVEVAELPEFSNRTYRIDSSGTVGLPLIGRVPAAGRTLADLELDLTKRLQTQVRAPHVAVGVVESRSQPVSVIGSVNTPGIVQLQGSKTLFDMVAAAGGLKVEAGDTMRVTRQKEQGPLNVPGATVDPTTGDSTAEVRVRDVVDRHDPKVNILVRPHDEISVSRAQVVYVIGNVRKAGGFTLVQRRSMSVLEALSLAEGLGPNAAPSHAKILRKPLSETAPRQQVPVNVKKVLQGKGEDLQLSPDDILLIPDNNTRRIMARAAETGLATVSGVIIWRGL